MSKADIDALAKDAEAREMCLHPLNERQAASARRMFKRGQLVRPFRELYARPAYWERLDPLERHCHVARALGLLHPRWTFCGVTAAALWKMDPSYEVLDRIHVITNGSARHSYPGIAIHQVREPETERKDGLRLTSILRTAYDCARRLSFTEGLVIADAALRLSAETSEKLTRYITEQGARGSTRGQHHALVTASYANPLAESGLESLSRAAMIRLGTPVPQLQAELPDVMGGSPYRVDFLWSLPGEKFVIGESDGRIKYENESMNMGDINKKLIAERQRESRLTALGYPVMRFTRAVARNPRRLEALMSSFGITCACEPRSIPELNIDSDW